MSELTATLVTQTRDAREVLTLPSHVKGSFPLRVVKGLELPASPTLIAPGVKREGKLTEELIKLADVKIGRLAEFISRIVVAEEPLYRNCVTFAAFLHSGAALDVARIGMGVDVGVLNEVSPYGLAPGDSHLIYLSDQKTAVHGVVGTNDPTEHLAVWGDNNPLAIGSNSAMLNVYQAAHVMKVDGRFDLT